VARATFRWIVTGLWFSAAALWAQLYPATQVALASVGTSAAHSTASWQLTPGVPWQVAPTDQTTHARILVVCVQFKGKSAVQPLSTFKQIYFGKSHSVANYYSQVSFGQFQLSGEVIGDPRKPNQFLQLPHTESYYAGKQNGTGSPSPHDDNQLVADVIYRLYAEHFNFSPYLQGNSLPYLAIVYSGYGADVAPQNAHLLWPVENTLAAPAAVALSGGDATHPKYLYVSNYDLVPELGNSDTPPTFGVFAHEFGHLLGLDDLYDTGTGSNLGQGDGPWSLMASGNWNGDPQGFDPAELDPYSRSLLGFVHPIRVSESITGLRLPPLELQPVVYDLAPVEGASKDFFLVDNVENYSYDTGLPGYGMMIWHIDGTQAVPGSYDWVNNVLNSPSQNKTGHYDEQVVEAGGANLTKASFGILDDPYPSMKGFDRFTAKSRPANTLWNGHSLGISLTHIAVGKDGYASFDVIDAQSGVALMIPRPATGLYAYQGRALNLSAQWLRGTVHQDVTKPTTWYSSSPGVFLQGHTATFAKPGYVYISAFYHHLTALLELRVIALSHLRVAGSVHAMQVGQRQSLPTLAAHYLDGKTQWLVNQADNGVVWRSVTPRLLLVEHGKMSAVGTGMATVEADFGGQVIYLSIPINK